MIRQEIYLFHGRVARPFASAFPTIDLAKTEMIPLGQFILWVCLACGFAFVFDFLFVPELAFEFAGAPSFAGFAKGGCL
jgi:hypothetical protein